MNEAIKRAIEGGWKPKTSVFRNSKTRKHILETFTFCYPDEESIRQHKRFYEYFLDPLFWQALGKAEGWEIIGEHDTRWTRDQWIKEWHRFIDHIASGGDIDTFFTNLLSQRE